MQILTSCHQAIDNCLETKTFALAHLYSEEKPMAMHIHDCYEIYYSISGGKQFLIDERLYEIKPGDVFVINQFESHHLQKIDSMIHERFVISIHPDYTKRISTAATNLDALFTDRAEGFSHRISLSEEQQNRFLYLVNKIGSANSIGADIIEQSAISELLLLILTAGQQAEEAQQAHPAHFDRQVDEIIAYINQHICEPLSTDSLARNFYMSPSYICRIFKAATGTTINKYVNARRISMAKAMLAEGKSITSVYEACGYNDYSNFLKTFRKAVGISPKKYAHSSNMYQ